VLARLFFDLVFFFFFSSRRRHTRFSRDWSSDVCSSDLRRGNKSDRILLGAIFVLSAIGLMMIYSATRSSGTFSMERQMIFVAARSEERRVGKECRSRWAAAQ